MDPDSRTAMSDDATQAGLWTLWMAMVEQTERARAMQRQLDQVYASRSWRLTAPLRALNRWLGGRGAPVRPVLAPPSPDPGRALGLADALALAVARGQAPGWMRVAASSTGGRRLLVDVSELALEDLGAGVQRVTRRVLSAMLASESAGVAIEPVRLCSDGYFVVARGFLASALGLPAGCLGGDAKVQVAEGDEYLALDFHRDHAKAVGAAVAQLRAAGVSTCFVAHDALPASRPEWFPDFVSRDYDQWLAMVSDCADAALCISEATRKDLLAQLASRGLPPPRHGARVFPLGADPFPAAGTSPLPAPPAGRTRVLMVGTVEPRKGHAQAVAAMELLWRESDDFELVVVGHAGWMTEPLAAQMREHPESGKRLHWLESVDDSALLALYRQCPLLLHASLGEGYGLPVAEAGFAGSHLLLRDLPVFREVAGDAADYFQGETAHHLADALRRWRDQPTGRARPDPARWSRWTDAAGALVALSGDVAANTRQQAMATATDIQDSE